MKNHPLYKKLKQAASNGDYTIEQVRSVTYDQAVKVLTSRKFSLAFLQNMKYQLIAEMQDDQDENDKQAFAAKVESLRSTFPDFEVERGRDGNKPYVKIWLKGKPEIPEVEP